ncbi:MAG: glycosyltransferase [Patescibacteria group bacterium]|nr:glycosyltransferase [Patescibacteria group bacterium]
MPRLPRRMKFSIVTPVHNGANYIAETIESVLSQKGDFGIDYIVADGASTDRTMEIVQSYANRVSAGQYPLRCKSATLRHFSRKDRGMYDALEKGFALTSGDVMAYLNADDRYLPGAFATVASILARYPDIAWVKGINTACDEDGTLTAQGSCLLYRQDWLQKGMYGRSAYFVQQDSVFWRRTLWEKARPAINSFRLAGDYVLWIAFAAHAPLWSFNRRVSVFRERPGQLSATMDPYRQEQESIAPHHFFLEKRVLVFFSLVRALGLNPRHTAAHALFSVLFPFAEPWWYIDFDSAGRPEKKRSASYVV